MHITELSKLRERYTKYNKLMAAKALGVSYKTFCNYEAGLYPPHGTLEFFLKWVKIYGCSVEELQTAIERTTIDC